MRRLTAWLGGAASGIAAYRFLRRQRAPVPAEPEAPPEPDERAEELRAKLAETRSADPVAGPVVEEPPAEPVAEEEPVAESESPEGRRQRVHEEGRAALGEMKPDGSA
jgi:hypothetical protein